MCNPACMNFATSNIYPSDVESKRIIEVGSLNVNGSYRGYCMLFKPDSYTGVDLIYGPGVDRRCNVLQLVEQFGVEGYDLVISTEMLEHVQDWRKAIYNMKAVLKPGGVLILTTRSKGFPYHEYPGDYWRFEIEDMKKIFADFDIEALGPDRSEPGVDLAKIEVYSMVQV